MNSGSSCYLNGARVACVRCDARLRCIRTHESARRDVPRQCTRCVRQGLELTSCHPSDVAITRSMRAYVEHHGMLWIAENDACEILRVACMEIASLDENSAAAWNRACAYYQHIEHTLLPSCACGALVCNRTASSRFSCAQLSASEGGAAL